MAQIIAAGIIPGGLEMMDNLAIRAAEDFIHAGYPVEAAAILLCELDGVEAMCTLTANKPAPATCGWPATRPSGCVSGRAQNAFPAVGRISPDYYRMDGTIPRRELPRVLKGISDLSSEYGLRVAMCSMPATATCTR